MDKFQYTLGWIAAIGGACVVPFGIFVGMTEGWGAPLLKLVWMPFVFMWGIQRIRLYRAMRNG